MAAVLGVAGVAVVGGFAWRARQAAANTKALKQRAVLVKQERDHADAQARVDALRAQAALAEQAHVLTAANSTAQLAAANPQAAPSDPSTGTGTHSSNPKHVARRQRHEERKAHRMLAAQLGEGIVSQGQSTRRSRSTHHGSGREGRSRSRHHDSLNQSLSRTRGTSVDTRAAGLRSSQAQTRSTSPGIPTALAGPSTALVTSRFHEGLQQAGDRTVLGMQESLTHELKRRNMQDPHLQARGHAHVGAQVQTLEAEAQAQAQAQAHAQAQVQAHAQAHAHAQAQAHAQALAHAQQARLMLHPMAPHLGVQGAGLSPLGAAYAHAAQAQFQAGAQMRAMMQAQASAQVMQAVQAQTQAQVLAQAQAQAQAHASQAGFVPALQRASFVNASGGYSSVIPIPPSAQFTVPPTTASTSSPAASAAGSGRWWFVPEGAVSGKQQPAPTMSSTQSSGSTTASSRRSGPMVAVRRVFRQMHRKRLAAPRGAALPPVHKSVSPRPASTMYY